MARFETWAEVARLFLGATCVGLLLILLLTAEAKKIEEKEEALVADEPENEKVVAEAGDISPLSGLRTVWSKLRQFISYSKDGTTEESGKRQKREVASEDYYSFPLRENQEEEISTSSSGQVADGLSSALLTSALDGHKIRHLDEKIDMLSEDNSLVKSIVGRFCGQETSVSYIMCLNAPENNTNTVHKESEARAETESEVKDAEKRARYEDAVLQHVDVMKNRLSPIQSSPLTGGFCTSTPEILIIVLITTCLNCGIFLFITFCKGIWQEVKLEDDSQLLHGDDALRKLEERARIWKEPRTV